MIEGQFANVRRHVMTSPERVSASVVDHRNGDQVFGQEFSGRMSIKDKC